MSRPVSDYAILGDCQTAALVGRNASIDWLCLPRYDSPPLFSRLADEEQGGYCEFGPAEPGLSSRHYVGASAILETTFETSRGSLCLTDFMPVRMCRGEERDSGQDVVADHRVIRILRCRREAVSVAVDVRLSSNGGHAPALEEANGIVVAGTAQGALHIQLIGRALQFGGDKAATVFRMKPGETVALVLTHATPGTAVAPLSLQDCEHALECTRKYWEWWAGSLRAEGEFREAVLRAAVTLKLLTHEPTGAIVSAPTAALPSGNGTRTPDGRLTSFQEASFTAGALASLGCAEQARDFVEFLRRSLSAQDGGHLHYTLDGEPAGGEGQISVFGEALACFYDYATALGAEQGREWFRTLGWPLAERAANFVTEHWRKPDGHPWLDVPEPRQYTYAKAMCWVALDRAVRLANWAGLTPGEYWSRERDALHTNLLRNGFNAEAGTFTQAFGSTELDSALLRLPLYGAVDANDPQMLGTIEAIEGRGMRHGFVLCDRNGETASVARTFWMTENLVLTGRIREARDTVRRLLALANDAGLLPELLHPGTGAPFGNFPQASTQVALIHAARRLNQVSTRSGGWWPWRRSA